MIWFSADHHFDHRNIIDICKRPFKDCIEMNAEIIKRHNEVVTDKDFIYFLGDLTMHKNPWQWLKQMNGKKIIIMGNHDWKMKKLQELPVLEVCQVKFLKTEFGEYFLSHYGHRVWPKSHYGAIHLYGHSHGTLPDLGKSMDVGVDTNNFYPYSIKEIKEKMNKIDYHSDNHRKAFEEVLI